MPNQLRQAICLIKCEFFLSLFTLFGLPFVLPFQHLMSEYGCILINLPQLVSLPSLLLLFEDVFGPLLELQLKLLNLSPNFSRIGL